MSDEVRSISEAADRMDAFGDANNGVIKDLPIPAGMFAELKIIKQGLETSGALRSSFGSAGKSGTQSKAAVYNSMYRRMRRISRTAATIKLREPDFNNKYQLPHDRLPYQEGFDRATAMYNDSAADEAKFLGYGMKTSFRTDLQTDMTAFANFGDEQTDAKMSSVGETATINSLVEQFMKIHPQLNQIMKNLFADDPEKLAEWRTAAHIERKKPKPKPPSDDPPTP